MSQKDRDSSNPPTPLFEVVTYLVLGMLVLLIPELSHTDSDVITGRHTTSAFVTNTVMFLGVWSLATLWWVKSSQRLKLSASETLPKDWLINGMLGLLPVAALAAWCKPFLSVDTTYYVAYGRQIVEYGLNPYQVNLHVSAQDPIISQVNRMWFDNVAFYGPVALALYSLANLIVSAPTLLKLTTTLKFLWLPFYLAVGLVVYKRWPKAADRWARALALVANPVLLWFALVDGHIDLLIALFLMATSVLMLRGKPALSALTLAIAASLKIVGIVCLPICFFWWFKKKFTDAVRFSATFVLVYGGLYGLVGGGEYLAVVEFTKKWNNVAAGSAVPKLFELLGLPLQSVQTLSNLFFYLSIAILCGLLIKGKFQMNPALPMACAMLALFLTRTYFQPWYTLWFWPLIWMACGDSKRYFGTLNLWTATMLAAWIVSWAVKGWLIGAVALGALIWVSWRKP